MGQKTDTFRRHTLDSPVIHYNGRVRDMMAISFAHCPFPATSTETALKFFNVTSYNILRYDVIYYMEVHDFIIVTNFNR